MGYAQSMGFDITYKELAKKTPMSRCFLGIRPCNANRILMDRFSQDKLHRDPIWTRFF